METQEITVDVADTVATDATLPIDFADTADHTDADGENDETETSSVDLEAVQSALRELQMLVGEFVETVGKVSSLQTAGNFKYLSKATRNELLENLLKQPGNIGDSSKAVFKMLKKVKRVRLTDELADAMLIDSSEIFY